MWCGSSSGGSEAGGGGREGERRLSGQIKVNTFFLDRPLAKPRLASPRLTLGCGGDETDRPALRHSRPRRRGGTTACIRQDRWRQPVRGEMRRPRIS
ncbi:hypothetical protein E2C01_001643 [Portunus trituberculatus]|uniref:Uncharacterized protein n=1 Tax=Portunus trituberculatus TaxID=210409 RepID=A0A5B7CJS9_PORTR|nr:hypothetical protein [Portunus trituberculatus]